MNFSFIRKSSYFFSQHWVKGTNAVGIGYGEVLTFILIVNVPCGSVSDIDGNKYKTVQISNKCWMAENLKTTKYSNGTTIPLITDGTAWSNFRNGAYCYYANNVNNQKIYGNLYNWYTVVDSNKIGPAGWHVPTMSEVNTLLSFLGGTGIAGGKLKEAGTVHWIDPNVGATNESGFTAIPSGDRNYFGNYENIGHYATFWITQNLDSFGGVFIIARSNDEVLIRGWGKLTGLPVRCLKD